MISTEGVDTLTIQELQNACQSRGIRFMGVSPARMKMELQQWLDLHLRHKIPSTLLILSRAYTIDEAVPGGAGGGGASRDPSEALRATSSSLPDTLVSQVELQASERSGSDPKSVYKQRLAVLEQQEELIADELEQEERARQASEKEGAVATEDGGKASSAEQAASSMTGTESGSELTAEQREQLREALRQATDVGREDLDELKQEHEEFKEAKKGAVENKTTERLGLKLEKLIDELDQELAKLDEKPAEVEKKKKLKISEDGRVTVDQVEAILSQV